MNIYRVGGAVRDKLLGMVASDDDYVVTGARPDDLLVLGYQPVGKDFPVFLHPQSKAAYALARTERKQGHGYHGFVFQTHPLVTLEEDLARRDLTINAIAEDDQGTLIDPFDGVRDLKARVLRHISPAFVEDPLRLLRVARFAARLAPLGFTIADETLALMRQMVTSGEVDHLVAERVWIEIRRALGEAQPSALLRVLRQVGALRVLLPEVDALYGVPQRAEYHPEIDTGIHIEMVLDAAAKLAPGDDLVGFCALTHDLGKALTPDEILPRHSGHEQRGLAPLNTLITRLKVPTAYAELARLVCHWHLHAHRALELRPGILLSLFTALDALRRPKRLEIFLTACTADQQGRLGLTDTPYPQADYLRLARHHAAQITATPFVEKGLKGAAISTALARARVDAITRVKHTYPLRDTGDTVSPAL